MDAQFRLYPTKPKYLGLKSAAGKVKIWSIGEILPAHRAFVVRGQDYLNHDYADFVDKTLSFFRPNQVAHARDVHPVTKLTEKRCPTKNGNL